MTTAQYHRREDTKSFKSYKETNACSQFQTVTCRIFKNHNPWNPQVTSASWRTTCVEDPQFSSPRLFTNSSQGSRWIGGDQHWATGPIIQLLMFVRWREMDGTGCWVEAQLGGGPPGHGLGRLLGIHVTVESEVVCLVGALCLMRQ